MLHTKPIQVIHLHFLANPKTTVHPELIRKKFGYFRNKATQLINLLYYITIK
jgi:hypothetical protein